MWSSEQFAAALKDAGAKVVLDVRKGMTHLGQTAGDVNWIFSDVCGCKCKLDKTTKYSRKRTCESHERNVN